MINLKDLKNNTFAIKALAMIDQDNFVSPWDEKQWNYEVNENPVSKVCVELIQDKIVAYIDYWITFDSSTIAKICVIDEFKRQGIASKLLDEMMSDLKANDVLYVTLEVRKSNVAAIKLYEKYGFKAITVKTKYYNDGEDALYMVREVK